MFEGIIPDMNKYREKAKKVLKDPIPEHLIKQREGGKGPNGKPIMLDYVEGSTVIRKLNAAFDNLWDWEPISFEIVQSQPKKVTKKWNNNTRRMEDLPQPILEEQAPVAHVVGRLTVPGFGARVGFGSKAVIGGASEQESCFKAAATDALKKAATLFGIGLELYEDEPVDFEIYDDEEPMQVQEQAPANVMPARGGINIPTQTNTNVVANEKKPESSSQQFDMNEFQNIQRLSKELGLTGSAPLADYISEMTNGEKKVWADLNPEDLPVLRAYLEGLVEELHGHMDRLGIKELSGLNAYIREFSEGAINEFANLNPTHFRTFMIYLERQ